MNQFVIFSYFLYSAIISIIALCNRLTHIISFIIAVSHSNQFYPIFARMAHKGKHRVITISTDTEVDSYIGGVSL